MKRVCRMMLVLSILLSITMSQTLSTQGVLRDASGQSVNDGNYTMTFRLYTVESGGSSVWTETRTVTVTNGVYNVVLGSQNPLSSLDYSDTYFLAIVMDGTEMSPRMEMTLSPYALTNVQGIDNVFPKSGNVGIGTISPGSELEVNGDISLSGYVSLQGTHMTFNSEYGVIDWGSGSSGDLIFRTLGSTGDIGDYTEVARLTQDGHLGIGTSSPSRALSVNGIVQLISNESNRYHFTATDEGLNFAETNVADNRLFIQDGGNVGIGTNNPLDKLHVDGNILINGTHLVYNSSNAVIDWGTNNTGTLYFRTLGSTGDITDCLNVGWLESDGSLTLKGDIYANSSSVKSKSADNTLLEIQKQFPDMVKEVEDPLKPGETSLMLNYTKIVPVLVQSINEQQAVIEDLQERLVSLEKMIKAQ